MTKQDEVFAAIDIEESVVSTMITFIEDETYTALEAGSFSLSFILRDNQVLPPNLSVLPLMFGTLPERNQSWMNYFGRDMSKRKRLGTSSGDEVFRIE